MPLFRTIKLLKVRSVCFNYEEKKETENKIVVETISKVGHIIMLGIYEQRKSSFLSTGKFKLVLLQ